VLHKRIEIEAIRKDGSEFPIELAIDVANTKNKELFVAYLRDISERKQIEAELHRQQALLESESTQNRLLLQLASDGVHVLNAKGRIILANNAFAHGLGYSVDEVIGMHPSQWMHSSQPRSLTGKFSLTCSENGHLPIRNKASAQGRFADRRGNRNARRKPGGEALLFCSSAIFRNAIKQN